MKKGFFTLMVVIFMTTTLNSVSAQYTATTTTTTTTTQTDSIKISQKHPSRLSLGGYGEVAYSRNFYSGNVFRYQTPEKYANDPGHGRFDLPHVVFFIGYEFGNGWRMNSEIEFEHGGVEAAMEIEPEEGGEYEMEVERGGEVVLEQFWIEKTFSRALNVRAGHILVPIGMINSYHLPTEFFTVYRPDGESSILPSTWHQTGISLWGYLGKNWKYEILGLPGLDSELFDRQHWIKNASASPYEFSVANKYAGALRIENYSVKGLRLGIGGYYGHSFGNSIMPSYAEKYKEVKGALSIANVDFQYKGHGFLARGSVVYGHLSDSKAISIYNRALANASPSASTYVASDAMSAGVEAGYDIMPLISKKTSSQLYLFGSYDYYDSMYKTEQGIAAQDWCERQTITAGINYLPLKDIVVKAEYKAGILKAPFNNENSFSIAVAYAGFFDK